MRDSFYMPPKIESQEINLAIEEPSSLIKDDGISTLKDNIT
jgi:hypothetical protein